ncbi:MAG: glutamate-binding protein of ABC transporter system [uncultured Solirubrobacteraceae bacterium]|uniref:Glutamate-binding protein of ABC transporter system n=1 Tax=uncultured Solirubrobacteraceae bacterium TaxID=1162706 RepID=A0A6J4RHY3_9ACTN|nr:MAG: glutamate-binding protein of ABC transporter system [uncultured Solirubrobacteraceae bacterium]
MDVRHLRGIALAATLALVVGGCGGSEEEEPATEVATEAASEFEAGTRMAELAEAGRIKIGVKKDQPGVGFQEPGADEPTGFDVEVAKIVAAKLGIEPDGIEWVEAVSKNREPFLQKGTVDLVAASYSITDERKEIVGQAGPYYVTGQQLLVREEDKEEISGPEELEGKKVCSVTGSTSIKTVEEEYGADPAPFATYSECVQQLTNGQVDAVTTDGAILLGYAAQQPDEVEVVGEPFSEERYGIGYRKADAEMCQFITETLQESFDDGSWEEAFNRTLGESGVDAPAPPELDPCEES